MALLVRTCFLMIVAASQSLLSAFGAGQAPAGRFDGEIAALLAADRTNPPPANSVVFAGSSTFRLWKTLGTDLAGFPVVNRGFGGSTMSDLNQYAAQIVIPLRPKTVVIYEGDNDIAAGTSPETILKEFETFAQTVEKTLPQVKIVIVSVKPSPSRRDQLERQRHLNALLQDFCRQDVRRTYVDVASRMMDARGEPLGELFLGDRLHMNAEGYKIWAREIRSALELMSR